MNVLLLAPLPKYTRLQGSQCLMQTCMWKCNILCWQYLDWKCAVDSTWLRRKVLRLAVLSMSESSPVNQALIAYVIGIILLLVFSMLIGMMIKSESEKQALILLNPETIASQVLNTGDSELCKKTWRGRFCPPVSMPLSHPDLQWTSLCPSNPRDVKAAIGSYVSTQSLFGGDRCWVIEAVVSSDASTCWLWCEAGPKPDQSCFSWSIPDDE